MKFEVEVVCEQVLPAVRRLIAQGLYEDYGLSQVEIARAMNLTQPTVSNYLREGRGTMEVINEIEQDPQIEVLVEEATSRAAKEQNYSDEISKIVSAMRDRGVIQELDSGTEKIL